MGFFFISVQIASGLLGWASARDKRIDPVLLPSTAVLCLLIIMPSAPDGMVGTLRNLLSRPDGSLVINWFTLSLFAIGRLASEMAANSGEAHSGQDDQSWASFKKTRQKYAEQENYYSQKQQSHTQEKKGFNEYAAPPRPSLNEEDIHLQTLGLKSGSSIKEIKSAYRKLAVIFHPDKAVAEGKSAADIQRAQTHMQQINDAYAWLEARAS